MRDDLVIMANVTPMLSRLLVSITNGKGTLIFHLTVEVPEDEGYWEISLRMRTHLEVELGFKLNFDSQARSLDCDALEPF